MRILIEEYPGSVDAARFLIAARDAGVPGPRLPADCRPQTQGQAFAVQRSTARLLRETRRDDIAAWKSALPTPENPWWLPSTSTVHFSAASPVPLAWRRRARRTRDRLRTGARPARARQPQAKPRSMPPSARAGWRWKCWGAATRCPSTPACRAAGRPHVQPGPGAGTAHRVRRRRARQHEPSRCPWTARMPSSTRASIPATGPRPVCTGWRASCVNKAPACAPASMSSLARMPASWTCRRAAISRSPTATWACCACASKRALNSAAGARLYCGAGPRACRARRLAHTRPATMLTLRPLTAEDHSLLAGWFSSLADVVQWGGSQLSYPLTPLRGNHAVGGRSTPPARPLLDGLPRWRRSDMRSSLMNGAAAARALGRVAVAPPCAARDWPAR